MKYLIVAIAFWGISLAEAGPMYITIEGDIDYSLNGPAEFVGQNMELTFMFDFSADGYWLYQGTTNIAQDTATQDYFFAQLLESTIGGIDFRPSGQIGDGYAAYYGGRGIAVNEFFLLQADDVTSVYTDEINFDDAYVGFTASETEWAYFREPSTVNSGTTASIQNRGWTITYLSSINPVAVPEPATLGIFSLGLAGLGWSRRKKV